MAVSKEVRGLAMHDTQPGEYPIGEGKDQVSQKDIENQDRRPSRIPLRLRKFISWIALFTTLGTFAEARRAGAQGPDIEPTKTPAAAAVVPTSPGGETDPSIVRIEDVGLIPIPDNNKEFKDAAAKAPKSILRLEKDKVVTVKVTKFGMYRGELVGVTEKGEIALVYTPGEEHGNDWFVPVLHYDSDIASLEVDMSPGMYDKKTSLVNLNTYIKSIKGPTQLIDANMMGSAINVLGYRLTTQSDAAPIRKEAASFFLGFRPSKDKPSPLYEGKEPEGKEIVDMEIVYTVGVVLHRTDYGNIRQEIKDGKIEIVLPNGEKWNPKNGVKIVVTRVPSDSMIAEWKQREEWGLPEVSYSVSKTGCLVIVGTDLYGTGEPIQYLEEVLAEIIKAAGQEVRDNYNSNSSLKSPFHFYQSPDITDLSKTPLEGSKIDGKWIYGAMVAIPRK